MILPTVLISINIILKYIYNLKIKPIKIITILINICILNILFAKYIQQNKCQYMATLLHILDIFLLPINFFFPFSNKGRRWRSKPADQEDKKRIGEFGELRRGRTDFQAFQQHRGPPETANGVARWWSGCLQRFTIKSRSRRWKSRN